MGHTNKYIAEVLLDAEQSLAELVAEAASVGDHDTAHGIREAAEKLRKLRSEYHDGQAALKTKPKGSTAPPLPEARPKFSTQGSTLISTYWDQKHKKVDVKKVEKVSFDYTVRALVALSGLRSGPFSSGEIIEQVQRFCDEGVHMAEIRASIKMLVHHGLIAEAGKSRYHVPTNIAKIVRRALKPRALMSPTQRKWAHSG